MIIIDSDCCSGVHPIHLTSLRNDDGGREREEGLVFKRKKTKDHILMIIIIRGGGPDIDKMYQTKQNKVTS